MKKRNGFVFMETIVVVSVLSITLLLLFSSYSYILRKSKERDTFDTTEMIYKTYFAKQVIDNFKSSNSVCNSFSNCYGIEYYIEQHMGKSTNECSRMGNFNSFVCDISKDNYNGYLSQLKNAYEVDKIYYANPKEVLSSSKKREWLSLFDATTIDYINELGKINSQLIIVKYKKKYNKADGTYEVFHSSIEVGQNSAGFIDYGERSTTPTTTKAGTPSGGGTTTPTTTVKKIHKVRFDVNGGDAWDSASCSGSNITFNGNCEKTVENNKAFGVMPTPHLLNRGFEGWYTSKNGGTKYDESTIAKLNTDIVLYAKWGNAFINIDSKFKTLMGKNVGQYTNVLSCIKTNEYNQEYYGIFDFDFSQYAGYNEEEWLLSFEFRHDYAQRVGTAYYDVPVRMYLAENKDTICYKASYGNGPDLPGCKYLKSFDVYYEGLTSDVHKIWIDINSYDSKYKYLGFYFDFYEEGHVKLLSAQVTSKSYYLDHFDSNDDVLID